MQKREILITQDHIGKRVDNFLLGRFKTVPKSLIYKLLRNKSIRVNNKKVAAHYKVCEKDVITLPNSLIITEQDPRNINVSTNVSGLLLDNIIFEDENFLVLNKPYSLAVHMGSGIDYGVVEALRSIRFNQTGRKSFIELAHRLDRDTSGCLLFAKKSSVLKQLHELFRNREIQKTYHMLVHGLWSRKLNKISAPLLKNVVRSRERIVRVSDEGKEAVTTFQLLESFETVSLVAAHPHTGRTHQIRVHAEHAGHAIIGDEKYADNALNQVVKQKYGVRRLCLHAHKIQFNLFDKKYSFTAEYDEVWKSIIKRLSIHAVK
ncbi:MAG: RluA family pseudouridine synthase [Alcanivoracaceae bacterium]|nr:RluA family pseudouridine synthase [Alcanivoracaceae bacterium]